MKIALKPVTLDMFADITRDVTRDITRDVSRGEAVQTVEPLQPNRRQKKPGKPGLKKSAQKDNKHDGFDHLAAARKLQWRLRKARSHSPEEMKAGRLICQHLLAMLDEASNDPSFPDALSQTQPQKMGAGC